MERYKAGPIEDAFFDGIKRGARITGAFAKPVWDSLTHPKDPSRGYYEEGALRFLAKQAAGSTARTIFRALTSKRG